MSIEEGLFSYLSTNAGLVALISTRIYPVRIPQAATLPCMTYQRISTLRLLAHDTSGGTGTARPRFQFDIWAASLSSAKAISEKLRDALNGYKGTMGTVTVQAALIDDERFDYDPETDLWRNQSDYFVYHTE